MIFCKKYRYISAGPFIKLINAKQSSLYGNDKTWVASHAIDGDKATYSVTSVDKDAWLQAELEQPAIISSVQLFLGNYAFSKGMFFSSDGWIGY